MNRASVGVEVLALAACGAADLDPQRAALGNADVLARTPALARRFAPEEVEQRFGVRRRGWVRDLDIDEADLATEAARSALADAALPQGGPDWLVAATSTSSRATRSLSARIGAALGLACPAFDVRAGGAAGLLAWHVACGLLRESGRTALVVAAEAVSPWLDLEADDPALLLFGDGAAAVVLAGTPDGGGARAFLAGRDDDVGRSFTVTDALPPRPGARHRFRAADEAYAAALSERRQECARRLAEATPLDRLYSGAPTCNGVEREAHAAGIASDRVHTSLAEHGALGAAAPLFPLADDRPPPGSIAGFTAVGGGVHWAALAWQFEGMDL